MSEKRPAPVRVARLIKATDKDRSFDLAFWKRVGAEGRFSVAWDMVLEAEAIRGEKSRDSRLQKSIEKIRRSDSREENHQP